VFLPFDPDEAVLNLLSERYAGLVTQAARSALKRTAMRTYYRLRPAMPRSVQIWLRRRYSAVQAKTPFPRWPAETALDDLQRFVLRLLATVAGEGVPWLRPWPEGKAWALVLTHDVETDTGLRHLDVLRDVERSLDLRSSWNFVPRRYHVPDETVRELVDAGFEVGVHGLYHDGRDLESLATLRARLPEVRSHAERWGSVGFRSPATHRRWEWMPELGFDYDSSYPDTDPFEPQGGGCCSLVPFFNDDLVELPITLPQDHTLFVILRDESERRWVEKTELIRERGGMALINVHPDYVLEPKLVAVYRRYLEQYAAGDEVWHALPRDVSAWWRRRAATGLERRDGSWQPVGVGAREATVAVVEPG
jgi:peptidoglycan/xylan/chitin deacetylase (PgdA/CDA1 family)